MAHRTVTVKRECKLNGSGDGLITGVLAPTWYHSFPRSRCSRLDVVHFVKFAQTVRTTRKKIIFKMRATMVLVVALATGSLALPRNTRMTDEFHISNEVIPESIEVETGSSVGVITTPTPEVAVSTTSSSSVSTVQETTKKPALDEETTTSSTSIIRKKNKQAAPVPTTSFSRIIDDIFNIPITVLRAVNTLLSNAFGTKNAAG